MAPEDTGSGSGSVQEPGSSDKSSDETSLAARRARLRGSLTRQATPPDPYQPDPYAATNAPVDEVDPPAGSVVPDQAQPEYGFPADDQIDSEQTTDHGNGAHCATPVAGPTEPYHMSAPVPAPVPVDHTQSQPNTPASASANMASPVAAPQTVAPPYPGPVIDPAGDPLEEIDPVGHAEARNAGVLYEAWMRARQSGAPPTVVLDTGLAGIVAAIEQTDTDSSGISQQPPTAENPIPASPEPAPTRGRKSAKESTKTEAPAERQEEIVLRGSSSANQHLLPVLDARLQAQTVEVLHNIDHAMGTCAMNLTALQKIATEQTDAMRSLADTMQSQNFFEIGLNLNSMIESMSAALEPMKAVGELVPAIDQLVVALESREPSMRANDGVRLPPEQLLLNLSDQLLNGVIDPWTFKSAYMAIYSQEQPPELLHRLVDLLGTQRLTGELFRAAYDAVQGADPPPHAFAAAAAPNPVVRIVQDEMLLAQVEELRRLNEELSRKSAEGRPHDDVRIEELQTIVEQLQSKLEQRENEFGDQISGKERELQDAQELLTSRWEEFNARYDEMTEMLKQRDEMLAEKEADLSRKESENNQLKAQMEELRDQTKSMVEDLHKQMAASAKPKEEQGKQSFFDTSPSAGGGSQNLFEPAPPRPLFQPQPQFGQQDQSQSGQVQQQQTQPQMQQQQMAPNPVAQPMAQAPSGNQAIPRPSATTPFLTGGSYGSGVRAQVFEVIVRQALAGAPWQDICAGPMQVNNISPEEVETEVKRRQALLKK